jgi:hypothetical protein
MIDFDLAGAIQAGYTPKTIANFLAQQVGFDVDGARTAGFTDERIISFLAGGDAATAFGKQFMQGAASSFEGIKQLAGALDEPKARAEQQAADIYSANNPKLGTVGNIVGNVLDPVALPAWFVAPLRAASLVGTAAKQGLAQGAFSGYVSPILEEGANTGFLSGDRLKNTAIGSAAGVVLGATLGKAAEGVVNYLGRNTQNLGDIERASKTAIADVADSLDNPPSTRIAQEQAFYDAAQRAQNEEVPPVREPLDATQVKLVEERIAKTEAEIAKFETDLANVQRQQPDKEVGDLLGLKDPTKKPTEKQVAALFKSPDNQDLPTRFGLVAPTPEAPAKQVAALFKSAAPSEVPVIKQQIVEASKQGTAQQYLLKQIETKKAEVERLKSAIAPVQIETKKPTTLEAPELQNLSGVKLVEKFINEGMSPADAFKKSADIILAREATQTTPLTAAQTQQLASLQKVLDDNGFKNVDEAVVASGRPDEVAAAQARIDAGTPQTPEQAVRGFQSGGAAATPTELLFADRVPFNTNAEKLLTGGQKRGANVAPVSANEQWNDLFSKAVGVLGNIGRKLRGRGEFGGSLEGTQKAGEKAAARMRREEGSEEEWVFKQDEQGNYPNIDKSWNRAEIEAFRPVYEEARVTLSANLDEINRLRDAGELTDAALQNLTYRSQLPIGIIGIYQGQRTKASDALNAFKLAKTEFEAGKEVKGLFQPGVDCQ